MAARDQEIVSCAVGAWTQITDADVTNITFQVRKAAVEIRATTNTTAPGDATAGFIYHPGQGELNKAVSDIVQLSGADRLWARPVSGSDAEVFVDHAA